MKSICITDQAWMIVDDKIFKEMFQYFVMCDPCLKTIREHLGIMNEKYLPKANICSCIS